MNRREMLLSAAALWAPPLWAHHGWEAFDTADPIYLYGVVAVLTWADPHPHFEMLHRSGASIPGDWRRSVIPRQKEPVDTARLLERAIVPSPSDRRWRVDLPSLARLDEWGARRPKIDDVIGVLGYPGPRVTGTRTVRAEILFYDGKAYPMRSGPA